MPLAWFRKCVTMWGDWENDKYEQLDHELLNHGSRTKHGSQVLRWVLKSENNQPIVMAQVGY
jgi:hypothetical protein